MYKNLRWKLLIIAAVAALAVWSFVPPSQKIKLGLDLKGGVHFVLQVKTDDALRLETETTAEQLRAALKEAGVAVTTRAVEPPRVRGGGHAAGERRAVPDDCGPDGRVVVHARAGHRRVGTPSGCGPTSRCNAELRR